jgi:hypothetical protein
MAFWRHENCFIFMKITITFLFVGASMKRVLIAFAFISLMASSSFGFAWQMYDFGSQIFDHNNNTAPIYYPNGVGSLPSPGNIGEGGEKFDLEGLHFAMEGNIAHVAIVNSFGLSAYSTGWHQSYALGDLFFGFDGSSTQYAIDMQTMRLYEVNSFTGIPNLPGSYYNYPTIRNAVGAWNMTSGVELGMVNHTMTFWDDLETDYLQPGNGDTYVLEFSFDMSLVAGASGASTISFHNTLACGNDLMNETYNFIPEPTSLLLLGIGLAGLGIYRRRHA